MSKGYLCQVIEAYKNNKLGMDKILAISVIVSLIVNKKFNKSNIEQAKVIVLFCLSFEIYKNIKLQGVPYFKFTIIFSLLTYLLKEDLVYANIVSTVSLFILKNIFIK